MFMRLFHALMPKEERFVERFIKHAGCIVSAAEALNQMMSPSETDPQARADEICAFESQADILARETTHALHRAFITPFSRSDIMALANTLDDTIDLIEDTVLGANLYRVTEFDRHMQAFAAMILDGAKLLAEAVPLLKDITGNAERLRRTSERISKLEGDADDLLREAMSELIGQRPDTITFFGRKEVYELLEGVTDSLDDVADVIEGIVLDHV